MVVLNSVLMEEGFTDVLHKVCVVCDDNDLATALQALLDKLTRCIFSMSGLTGNADHFCIGHLAPQSHLEYPQFLQMSQPPSCVSSTPQMGHLPFSFGALAVSFTESFLAGFSAA